MRRFLLTTCALLMAVCMMAVGNATGVDKANAIDFDWETGNDHAAGTNLWYRVDLAPISGLVDPTLALYLTNLSDSPAKVEVDVYAKVSYSLPIPGFKPVEKDTTFRTSYTIGAKGYELWSENVKDLLKLNVTYLDLNLSSTQNIKLSAKKYETSDIVDLACDKAKDFDWAGEEVMAGETWYRLNLSEIKTENKKLNFVVKNEGGKDATVKFDLSLDCPASVVFPYNWTIAAGGEMTEEFGRIFIDELKEDYIYLKLTTDEELVLSVEEEVVPVVPVVTWTVNDVLTEGEEYTFTGEYVFEVPMSTLTAPRGMRAEFVVTNNNGANVTLSKQISFANPVKSTIDKELTVEANATVVKEVVNNMAGVINSEMAYVRFNATGELTVRLNYVVENEEIMNAKPIEISSCENSKLLDWNSVVKQAGLETKWYEIDLSTIKQNDQHLQLTFANKSDKVVIVMGEILRTCASDDTIPYILPVQPGETLSQVINYNMFALLPHPKHFYVSATVIPTTATSIKELSSIRSKEDIMALVPADLDALQAAEVELTAQTISAIVDPTNCNQAVTIARGVKYEQAAGTTKWYRVTDELLNSLSLIPDIAFINNGKKAANISLAATVDCNHATFGLTSISVPTWADLTMFPSRLVGNLLDKAFNGDVKEMYLQVTTDEAIAFGIDINYGFGLGCDDARKFNWETGAVVMPGDAQWLDFDITSVKENKQQVKLTLTNESNSLAWVGMMVSLTCPFKVALPTFFAIPAGMSIDKVVDYSYFAATKLDQLYIALITEEKISVKATAVKATASATDQAACANAIEVKNGEAYVHNPGTTWYKFDRSMFSDVSRLPKFRYAAEATTNVTFGATVGCEYNIATHATLKFPSTKGLEVSFRLPGFISEIMDKFVNSDVKEFYLELNTDKQIKFGMDMEYAGGCEKAAALNLKEEIDIDLKAGEDAWYQIDLNKIKAMGDEMINLNLMNPSDKAVEVEFEVTPTCPLLVSAIKAVSVPANTNLPIAFPASTIIKLYDEVLERLNVPEKITNNLPNALKDDMVYYVRVRANGDLHIDNEDNTIERPEGCEDAKELDLSKTINLSSIKTGWYHVDLTPLKNGSIKKVSINNDLGKETGVKFDFFRNCEEARSFYAYTHLFKVGLFEQSVPSYALSLLGNLNELYIYITMDVDVLTCEDAIEFDWSKGAVHSAGDTQWYHFDITSVENNEQQVKLTFTNYSDTLAVIYGEVALHCPYQHSIPYACVVPGGMSVDKVIDYSVFKASRVEELYVKVHSTETIELGASTESALVFDQTPCNNATLVESGVEYNHAAGTVWYKLPKSLFVKNTGKLPKFYFTTEKEGFTKITLGATVGCEYNIATKAIVALPGSLNYAMVMPEQMFDVMDKFVSDDVTEVYIEMTTDEAVRFTLDMVNNTDDACHDAELMNTLDGITLEKDQDKWYKIDLDALKAMNSDVAVKLINPSANSVNVDMEVSLTCPVVLSANKSLTLPAAQEVTKVIRKSILDKIPGVSFYVRLKADADVKVEFDEPETPEDEQACSDAILLNWTDTINMSELTTGWYKFDLTQLHANPGDFTLNINNDLGYATYLGLELYQTCETGRVISLGDSIAEGLHIKTVSYSELTSLVGKAPVVYAYITIGSKPTPPVIVEGCETAVEYVWGSDIQLNADEAGWYKLAIADLHNKTCNITLTANNASMDTVRADVNLYSDCPVTVDNNIVSMTVSMVPDTITSQTISSDKLPTDVDTVYLHVEATGMVSVKMNIECLEYAYDTIASYGCVDAQQMWNDTVHVSSTLDSVYTYIVNPFEAPVAMTDSILASIVGAVPVLNQGVAPDMTESANAIKAYYQTLDTEAIADVASVTWEATTVDCDALTHTITLFVVDACNRKFETVHTFSVTPKAEGATLDTMICEGDVLVWWAKPYTATGTYTYTVKDANGCDIIHTLNLNVVAPVDSVDNVTIYSDVTYVWPVNGKSYNQTIVDTVVVRNSLLCDSIYHILNLTVLNKTIIDSTITELVCDGTEYIDPVTNEKHIISSLIPATCAWNDTIVGVDTNYIYRFVITPIVAPEEMTNAILSSINAIPVLKQGEKPQVDASIAAIKAYYATNDTEAIADVDSVVWSDATNTLACDAAKHTMTLTILAGCDNELVLPFEFDVEARNVVEVVTNEAVCEGQSYSWIDGNSYNVAGQYRDTVKTAFGCDSVINILNLTVNKPVAAEETVVICGTSYSWNGQDYTTSGDHTFTTTAANGCDSVVTLHLTLNQPVATEETVVICGTSYTWNGQDYTTSGDHTFTTTAANGCDSVVTLHLTINQPVATEETVVMCGTSYSWNGQTYTTSGDHTFTTTAANGCDSVVTLHLTLNQPAATEETAVACGSYAWNGQTYTTSGDYTFTTTTVNGCDSVVTLHLTINQPAATEETVVTCGSYAWNGQDYTTSGDYTFTTTAANGCDSVVTLHLTILPDVVTVTEVLTICESEFPYAWRGETLTAVGSYSVTEQYVGTTCDSVIYELTLQSYVMTLPANITMPIAVCGNPVDVADATADVEDHIVSTDLYAPNAVVTWFVDNNGSWTALNNDLIKGGVNDVTVKYVITSDCGSIESNPFTVTVEAPTPENDVDMDNILVVSKYENRIFLVHLNDFMAKFGWTPTPEEVTWYKVVGEVDTYGVAGDDIVVGTGHSYNEPDGSTIQPGDYYALIIRTEVENPDDCHTVMRSLVLSSAVTTASPQLVANVVRPSDDLTLINLNAEEITEIYVYDMVGNLVDKYIVDQASEFVFDAARVAGYYLVEVQTTNTKTTLRYIVK